MGLSDDTPPWISVVVPAHNAQKTIDHCLQALTCQTVPRESYEIVVVDDGSSDDTVVRVRQHSGVRLVGTPCRGPSAARNLGVQQARGELVLFTDSDCEPAPDWIERMVVPFSAATTCPDDRVVGVKGTYLSHQRELVARFVQIEYEDRYDRMARERYIDFVDTYAAGYRRDVLIANGGFDVSFTRPSVEDQEFSFRLARRGYKMVFVPEAHVYHSGHARNLPAYWRKKFWIGYWKVRVHVRHPGKVWRDSHTPQVLKVQILLAGLGGLGLCGALIFPRLWPGVVSAGLLFLLTTLPFTWKAWRKDARVGIAAPGLLLVRALALGSGFALGVLSNLLKPLMGRA